jgi:putative ABC transport system permease protein
MPLDAAREQADAVAVGLEAEHPGPEPWRIRLTPVDATRGDRVDDALTALGATVAAMFLIALLNSVNLLLVRTTGRAHELGVRVALGASRARLFRQLAMEGVVLGLLAGVAATLIAWAALLGIRQVLPTIVTYVSPYGFEVETRTLLFAFAVAALAGLILGLLPGIGAVRGAALSASFAGRGGSDGPARRRLQEGLVVGQVGLSMVLLVSAGLLINGFARLHTVDVGFDVDRIVLADLEPSPSRYATRELRVEFGRRLEEALERTPEIDGVALTSSVRAHSGEPLEAEGLPIREDQPSLVPWAAVSGEYATVVGLRLVAGRTLGTEDMGIPNVVVDRDLARFLWADRSPLDRRFRVGDGAWMTVVGVVEELRLIGRDERAGPHQYLTFRDPVQWASRIGLAIRSSGAPSEALIPIFQRTLHELDPEQSYWRVVTAGEALAFNEEEPRFVLTLMSLLAAVATSLATIGLYGVLSYAVARRTRELGVRVTLGAEPGTLVGAVVREGLATAVGGIGLGLILALLASAWLERLLYDVAPRDPLTYAAVTALFIVIAALASLVPARRATRVDPVEVLRAE